jgi:hypothetical protein
MASSASQVPHLTGHTKPLCRKLQGLTEHVSGTGPADPQEATHNPHNIRVMPQQRIAPEGKIWFGRVTLWQGHSALV